MKTPSYICGLDYSIVSPALCVYNTSLPLTPENCEFYFFHKKPQKFANKLPNHHPLQYPLEYNSDIERFSLIADGLLHHIPEGSQVVFEGYSMNSRGKVFNISECTAIMKYKLFAGDYEVLPPIPPTSIKKTVTGKGNANKRAVYDYHMKTLPDDYYEPFGFRGDITKTFVMDTIDAFNVVKTQINC